MMVVRKTADEPNDDMFNNNLMKKVLIQNIDVDLHIAQTIQRGKENIKLKQKKPNAREREKNTKHFNGDEEVFGIFNEKYRCKLMYVHTGQCMI